MPEITRSRQSTGRRGIVMPPKLACEWLRSMLNATARNDQLTYEHSAEGLAKAGWRLERIDTPSEEHDPR